MSYRKVESMLYNYEKNKCKLKNIELDIANAKNNYRGVSSVSYEEKTSPNNSFVSIVENEVVDREERISKLEVDRLNRLTEVTKIQNALGTLEERELKIIKLKYFERTKLTDEAIGKRLFLSGARVQQIRRDVIKKMIEMLNLINI